MSFLKRLARPHIGDSLESTKNVVVVRFNANRLKRISAYDLDRAKLDYEHAAKMVDAKKEPCDQ
jgi:hypothetical protein